MTLFYCLFYVIGTFFMWGFGILCLTKTATMYQWFTALLYESNIEYVIKAFQMAFKAFN